MNWIDSNSRVDEGVIVGSCKIHYLLFADDLVLHASSEQGLLHTLHRFSAACDQAGMKISTKKTGIMYLQKPMSVYAASERQYIAASREVQVPWGGIHE